MLSEIREIAHAANGALLTVVQGRNTTSRPIRVKLTPIKDPQQQMPTRPATEFEALRLVQRVMDGDKTIQREVLPADVYRRLLDAVRTGGAGSGDYAGLVRQVLLRSAGVRVGGADVFLDVPSSAGWPSSGLWEEHSCSILHLAGDRVRVRARSWQPTWLGDGAEGLEREAVLAGADPASRRRPSEQVSADPFFTAVLGPTFSHYRGAGQQQAVRAASWLAPGATLMVNLPTGSGKTEVALAPALFWSRSRGVSVIVVPTVSLAQDMDRRICEVLARTGAVWTSVSYTGQTEEGDRRRIREAVASGELPVVVTSPESGSGSLRPALRRAAAAGLLKYFVVDEAHLIREWGTDFRPDLQGLAALRRELVQAAPASSEACRTLLLSATFSQDDLEQLPLQFSDDGLFGVVAANRLRPEPDYWVTAEADEESRSRRVIEAVRHLPRPIFLYASWVDDAENWVSLLRNAGYSRVARVTGSVPGVERAEVLRALRGDTGVTSVDVVVATSAFGLGISFDEVRSVVHACLPESIDRLYQEVGRAGRDGNASLSLVAWTPADREKAGPLSRTVVIGWQKAKKRWEAMVARSSVSQDGFLQADLTAVPEYGHRNSDLNESWNRATLALMARADFIRYSSAESEEIVDTTGRRWAQRARVSVRRGDLSRDHVWQASWSPLRDKIHDGTSERRRLVEEALRDSTRLCETLVSAYRVRNTSTFTGVRGLTPARTCGQCSACRGDALSVAPVLEPEPLPNGLALGGAGSGDRTPTVVLVKPPASQKDLRALIAEFIDLSLRRGVRLLVVPEEFRDLPVVREAHVLYNRPVVLADYDKDVPWNLPQVDSAVVARLSGRSINTAWTSGSWLPSCQVLVPTDAPSVTRPDRTIDEVPPAGALRMDDLRGRS